MRGLPQKQNTRRAYKIRLCGHLRRYKSIVKKTYIIFLNTYIINYFIYTNYNKKRIVKEIKEAMEQTSFKAALKLINYSAYNNNYIQLLINNKIEKYIDYLIPNKVLLKVKYKMKYLIYKIIEQVC